MCSRLRRTHKVAKFVLISCPPCPQLYPKLLQAKQAADLHTPGFNQRVVYEVIKDGFLRQHVPTIRARYKAQRDAMRDALQRAMRSSGAG
jgi:2-aminoadipate transaminase